MPARRWLVALGLGLVLATAGCLDGDGLPGSTRESDDNTSLGTVPSAGSLGDADPSDEGSENGTEDDRLGLPDVALEEVVTGLVKPTLVTSAQDGTDRLFVLEQPGRVRVVVDDELVEDPYLDLPDRTKAHGERGLLGLAFDPAFAVNGRLYLSYTGSEGDSVVRRFTVEDPLRGRPSGEGTKMLSVEQPYRNHNGGHVVVGPDGYLYYGLGDGGSLGDPRGNGQDPTTLLGSLLRLNVSGEEAKAPDDNPFVDDDEGHDLVWAYGLRNPWRFSFDRETGDLFIGDVGEQYHEEVDHQPAGSAGGENYGWNDWEGNHAYAGAPSREGYTFPILEYGHGPGRCSVTGGHVYRGPAIDDLEGFYVYGDFCGTVWAARNTSEGWRSTALFDTEMWISSFGEDADGEVYVVARGGSVHRIVEG